jgi:putative transposase
MMINRSTMNYRSRRDPQHALRVRELAASQVRFGYRRLTVMLRREGWAVNAKRIYRLYTEDGLAVRTKGAQEDRAAQPCTGAQSHAAEREVVDGFCRRPLD